VTRLNATHLLPSLKTVCLASFDHLSHTSYEIDARLYAALREALDNGPADAPAVSQRMAELEKQQAQWTKERESLFAQVVAYADTSRQHERQLKDRDDQYVRVILLP